MSVQASDGSLWWTVNETKSIYSKSFNYNPWQIELLVFCNYSFVLSVGWHCLLPTGEKIVLEKKIKCKKKNKIKNYKISLNLYMKNIAFWL